MEAAGNLILAEAAEAAEEGAAHEGLIRPLRVPWPVLQSASTNTNLRLFAGVKGGFRVLESKREASFRVVKSASCSAVIRYDCVCTISPSLSPSLLPPSLTPPPS